MNGNFFINQPWLGRTKVLLWLALFFLGFVSCRQVVPPPPSIVKLPQPQETRLVPSLPPEKETAQEEAQAVMDIPPPVPILPPMKGEVKLPPPETVKIVVKKGQRKLFLYQQGELLNMYPVDLGENPKGPKICQGDNKTPEGQYCFIQKKDRGQTKFYQAFLLNYPNEADRIHYDWAVINGWIPKDIGIGGLIEIHGEGVGGVGVDWTNGCIALLNRHMEELFSQVPVGTPVWIEP
jgi:lipoprotein-anchoring transpeptidase ErfK/SrfK